MDNDIEMVKNGYSAAITLIITETTRHTNNQPKQIKLNHNINKLLIL